MANFDLDYEGSEVQDILDTGKSLEDDGYIFLGTATPSTIPGTPTERVAYVGGPGTYNNFGTTVVVPSGSIVAITYSGSAWSKTVINASLPVSTTLGSDNTTIPTSKAVKDVTDAINTKLGEGYLYAGIATAATNPGTPTVKVFYLARQAGTYTNFGCLTLTEGVNILKFNGTTWSQEQLISIADIYKNPLMGYYECDTAGGTAAKTVAATGYVLPTTGGSVKIKMSNRNTVANATLNINSTGAKPLIYNGQRAGVGNTWDTNEIVEVFYDGTNYQAYNVAGSNGDGVFDISAYNLTDGQPTPYVDLEAALGTNGVNIPESIRKGGMSVKFIQGSVPSFDNKYLQYRLMNQNWSTTVSDWQGVDDEPTAGSENLVKSNGVDNVISTMTANSGAEKAKFSPYILNCYIIPTTAEKYNYLKALAEKTIMLYYMAVRNNNLGSNNVFGIMLKIGDSNYGTYYIDEVPNLLQGNIVELSKKWTTAGELANGFRVFVEFNQQIDFSTATSLISSNAVFVNPINRVQISYLFEVIRLQSQVSAAASELADKDAVPTGFSSKLVKSGGVFGAIHKLYSITSLSHFDKTSVVVGYVNHETGNIHSTENYRTSDYIAVSSGIEYKISNNSNLQVAIYDSNLSFIKGYVNTNSFNVDGQNQIPANGAYIRFSMAVADLDNAGFYVSSEYAARHNWESTTAFKEEVVADAVKGTIINRTATIQHDAGTEGLINVLSTIVDTENYHYTIYLEAGTYNLYYEQIMALPDVGFGKIGILLPDNVDLVGLGSGAIINCDLTGKEAAYQQYISPLNIKYNNKLKNLTITINNGRYAVHADNSNGVQDVKWEIVDCKFVHYGNSDGNWAYPSAWGEGGCSGMDARFNNCTFISPRIAYLAHNNVDYEKPSYHKMENCKFISSDKTLAVQIASLGSGVKDIFEFIGCQFDGLFDSRASSTTPNVQSCDFEVIGYGNSPVCENWHYADGVNYHSNFSDEVIPFTNHSENTISAGTFMKYDSDELKPMVDGDNTVQFVGICLDNVAAGGTGYIKVKGTYRVTAPAEVVWATLGTKLKVGSYNSFAVADNINFVGKMYYRNTAYTRYYILLQ